MKTGYNRWFKGFRLPADLSPEDEAELRDCLTLTREEISRLYGIKAPIIDSFRAWKPPILMP